MSEHYDLGAAWEAVEAALPEWWRIRSLIETPGPLVGWEVVATDGGRITTARGATPAAALRALAATLPLDRVEEVQR